jgi:hypothetical protein
MPSNDFPSVISTGKTYSVVGPPPHSPREIGIAVAVTPTTIIIAKTVGWIDP